MKKIRIRAEGVVKEASLNTGETASALWDALPIEGTVNRWGDEIYFAIPVTIGLVPDARADVDVGDVAYWPPGRALCVFWGPTPASPGPEPRAASPVNVFGKVTDRPEDFSDVRDGEAIRIERVKD